ncbi:hypothetical protein Cwoe_2560 [Conexibacter woesei DSM 14684]|uniref:Uncharacterized protein n=2 Tax=Conexibacter TaxID=191494 RepID=D3F8L7_CONWI|nr:hypothetical protein Cwoe_2560 [Conexibacter woesei DSM 14684]
MVTTLGDPRKRTIVRFALDRRGEWTVDQLHERHPAVGPVRDAHTLCMQLAVVGLLAWIPTDETRLRHQPFRLRDASTAAAALASYTV